MDAEAALPGRCIPNTIGKLPYGLGVQWLSTLDDILWNFRELTMKFIQGTKFCELRDNETNSLQLSSPNRMKKMMAKRESVASIQLCNILLCETSGDHPFLFTTQVQNHDRMNAKLEQLLTRFEDLFHEPTELPPKREVNH